MNWKRVEGHGFSIPKRQSECAAGYDLATIYDVSIDPGASSLVSTGWAVEIPPGHVGLIRDRSGLAMAGVTTRAGVIDSDYRGEVRVLLRNESDVTMDLSAGSRVAQLVVIPCVGTDSIEVTQLGDTHRGSGGFGSTGR